MALHELTVKNLKPKTRIYRKADSHGLCIEISPTGGKLWRYRYRFNGKAQMVSLGRYPLISLLDARKLRDEYSLILSAGKNPVREKQAKKLRQGEESENTFEKVARSQLAIKHKNMNAHYRKACLSRLKQYVFPVIGNLPITEITTPDVVKIIEQVADNGTLETAKRIRQLISQTFRYATQRGICKYNPAADLKGIVPPKPEKHHPCIPINELPELLKKIDAREEDMSKHAMQFLALTFVRTAELIGAKWEEIDLNRAEWHIPKERMKMKRPHMVPLSKQAIDILTRLKDITGDKPFVFHSFASKSKHISNGTVLMALRRMGYYKRMSGHGFRTLASTILNEKGYRPDVIERQLAHEDSDKIRSAYNRAEHLLERKKMMQDYADILDTIKKEDKGKVTILKTNRSKER